MPTTTNLMLRDDTLLGVCQGLGEDVGFNPNWLRIALGAVLVVSPMVAIGAYLALGVVVMLGRFGWPSRVVANAAPEPAAPVAADNDEDKDGGVALAKAA